jgi:transposase InsO family protein
MTSAFAIQHSPFAAGNDGGADWLPIDQVVGATGLSARAWRSRASVLAARGQAELRPPPSGKSKPIWWFHRGAHPALAQNPDGDTRADRDARTLTEQGHPEHLIDRALRKRYWLNRWQQGCPISSGGGGRMTRRQWADRIVRDAKQAEGPGFKISLRSLQLWHRAYHEPDPTTGQIRGLAGLVDNYVGWAVPTKPSRDREGAGRSRSPAALDYFYSLYRDERRLSIQLCHEATVAECRQRDWTWPPSYSATKRWLGQHDDRSLTYLLREGKDAWCHRFMGHLESTRAQTAPGMLYESDHKQCNFWVTYKGKQIRPWFTAIIDHHSRCVVGWHLGPVPHQDAILAALRMAFTDWAIPEHLKIDNGRDFTSKLITGLTKREVRALRREYGSEWKDVVRRDRNLALCDDSRWLGITGELGIELIYAIPYAPWSKGTVERWFKTFDERHGKTISTWCGRKPSEKPAALKDILRAGSEVPTLEAMRADVAQYLDTYHARPHRGAGMNGRAPLTVWQSAVRLRQAVADELAFLMDVRGVFKVSGIGVRVTVGSATLSYGRHSAALKRFVGRRVLVAVDPNHVDHCWAFTAEADNRRLIGRLPANESVHPAATTDDVRDAIAEVKRDQSVALKAQRGGVRRSRTVTQRMAEHRRREHDALRATGTDDVAAEPPTILPVRTGFESASKLDRRSAVTPSLPDVYAAIDVDDLDLADDSAGPVPADPYADVDFDNLSLIDEPADADDPYAAVDLDDLEIARG